MLFCTLKVVFVGAFWAATIATSVAAPAEQGWLTGPALEKQLASPTTISLSNTPLSRALTSIGAAQHVASVRDRRVDPDREIQLALTREPLRIGLQRIADQLQIGYCQLGGVAYFGPAPTARRLRTVAALRIEDVKALPAAATRKFLLQRTSHWDDLAEPRKLLDALAQEAGVVLVGADKIPHDLWAAADLPLLSWIDRLTLLAAQFDLTFRIQKGGEQVELVPMPEKVVLTRTYQAGPQAVRVARRWAEALQGAKVTVDDKKIRVEGTLEDHDAVEHRLRGAPTQRTTVTPGKEIYQLAVEQAALSQVLEKLAQRLSLEFQWDRAVIERAGLSLDQLVSVNVQNATLDELLTAILQGTGLAYRKNDRAIMIYPAEAKNR